MHTVEEQLIKQVVSWAVLLSFTYYIFLERRLEKLVATGGTEAAADDNDDDFDDTFGGKSPSSKPSYHSPFVHRSYLNQSSLQANIQHHSRGRSSISKAARLLKLSKFARVYYAYALLYASFIIVKNGLVCLLDLDYFKDYRYLDCYLVGRFVFDARSAPAAKYLVVLFNVFQVIWVGIMVLNRPSLSFSSLDFLLYDYNEVLEYEAQMAMRERQRASEMLKAKTNHQYPLPLAPHRQITEPIIYGTVGGEFEIPRLGNHHYGDHYESTIFFRNQFHEDEQSDKTTNYGSTDPGAYMMRPNRTSRAWLKLVRFSWYYFAVLGLIVMISLPVFAYVLISVLVTNEGFELNYANCVDYIMTQTISSVDRMNDTLVGGASSARSRQSFATIYEPAHKSYQQLLDERRNAPIYLPISGANLRPGTVYDTIRLLVDLLDNLSCWSATCFSFTFDTYIAMIIVYDMHLYSNEVRDKLLSTINRLRWSKLLNESSRFRLAKSYQDSSGLAKSGPYNVRATTLLREGRLEFQRRRMDKFYKINARRQSSWANSRDINDLQALLIDYFNCVRHYNSYVAFFTLFCTVLWLAFTTVSCIRLLDRDTNLKIARNEIYLLEGFASVYFLLVVGCFSTIRVRLHRMYGHLTAAMALDTSDGRRKRRWIVLLNYFHPTPMYCFSIFRATEISWLFCLKLVSWILSAVLVATSFNQVYR